jgi:hypothetical protein
VSGEKDRDIGKANKPPNKAIVAFLPPSVKGIDRTTGRKPEVSDKDIKQKINRIEK